MRSFISIAAAIAALTGYPVFAEDTIKIGAGNIAPPFAEDGVYIPAGETIEVAIAGECHRFTNHDTGVGFFFSPDKAGSWPGTDDSNREPREPIVSEAPCE